MTRNSILGLVGLMIVGCGDSPTDSTSGNRDPDAATGSGGSSTGGSGTGNTNAGGSGIGGTSAGGTGTGSGGTGIPGSFALPPEDGPFDYQIGGAYDPPSGVTVVSRDREDAIAEGLYNICYINGFQAQPQDDAWWLEEHPDLVLRDSGGNPVIDEDWDEMLLDTSTPEKRGELAQIVGAWIHGCAQAGYDAIEIDNLDTYSRSGGLLSEDNNVAFMALLSDLAHENGMASGQKNSAEILARRAEMKTDFAVAEECNRYDECGDYTNVYGNQVYVIEYRDQDFEKGCAEFSEISIVRRDLDVSPAGSSGYVFDGC